MTHAKIVKAWIDCCGAFMTIKVPTDHNGEEYTGCLRLDEYDSLPDLHDRRLALIDRAIEARAERLAELAESRDQDLTAVMRGGALMIEF